MASTRNNNTPGNYYLEQKQYQDSRHYKLYKNSLELFARSYIFFILLNKFFLVIFLYFIFMILNNSFEIILSYKLLLLKFNLKK